MCTVLIITIIAIDQVTKFLAPILNIPVRKNFGIAFGFFSNSNIIITIAAAGFYIIITILIYQLLKKEKKNRRSTERIDLTKISLALFISGGLGNLIDKLFFGFIRDFIDLKIWTVNIADIVIVLGLLIYVHQIIQS